MAYSSSMYTKMALLLISLAAPLGYSASINLRSAQPPSSQWLSKLRHGHTMFQLGGYWSAQGKSQHVNIEGLIGDTFTLTKRHDSNALFGFGYYIDGPAQNSLNMSYGVHGFYLPRTSVSGNVVQEDLFTNLSYGYHLTHYPVYAIAKSTIPLKSTKESITLDLGVGPNFMQVRGFQEYSRNVGVTIPDTIFSGRTSTTFSATAGIGIQINNVFGNAPLACGYRFFYLGQGRFNTLTSQLLNTLKTGSTYANAVMCGIKI